jgi:hypothetical protein
MSTTGPRDHAKPGEAEPTQAPEKAGVAGLSARRVAAAIQILSSRRLTAVSVEGEVTPTSRSRPNHTPKSAR